MPSSFRCVLIGFSGVEPLYVPTAIEFVNKGRVIEILWLQLLYGCILLGKSILESLHLGKKRRSRNGPKQRHIEAVQLFQAFAITELQKALQKRNDDVGLRLEQVDRIDKTLHDLGNNP